MQRAVQFQHRNLGDEGAGAVDTLQVLGEHVLASAEDNHLLPASLEVQETLVIEHAQVAGAEPAVPGEGIPVGLRVVAVAVEDIGAAQLDLADAGLIGLGDAQLAALERPSLAADALPARQVAGESRRRLGKPVSVAHGPAEALELPDEPRLEGGAAGDQQAQAGADARQQGTEQQPPGPPAEAPAQPDGEAEQLPENECRQLAARGDLRLDIGDQGRVEPRHADNARRAATAQRLGDLRAGEAFREDHRGTAGQRHQQADDEGVDVVQRQGQQDPVVRADQLLLHQARHIGVDVGTAEGEILRRAGGAGGVDQHHRGLLRHGGQGAGVLAQQLAPGAPGAFARPRIQQVDGERLASLEAAQQVDVLGGDEGGAATAGAQQPLGLFGRGKVIAGHRERPGGTEAEAHRHPLGTALAHEEDRLTLPEAKTQQAVGQLKGTVGKLGVGPALHPRLAGCDQRGLVAVARDVVEQRAERPARAVLPGCLLGHAAASRSIATREQATTTGAPGQGRRKGDTGARRGVMLGGCC